MAERTHATLVPGFVSQLFKFDLQRGQRSCQDFRKRTYSSQLEVKDLPDETAIHWRGGSPVLILKTVALFVITAVAEIVGCYLPYLWLKKSGSILLLIPALASLALFAWLLTLHPTASGRTYAAYGGVYVAVAMAWLWKVDRVPITVWDVTGAAVTVVGMGIIVWGGWKA
jgi:small multidrug resistance family-3 protein